MNQRPVHIFFVATHAESADEYTNISASSEAFDFSAETFINSILKGLRITTPGGNETVKPISEKSLTKDINTNHYNTFQTFAVPHRPSVTVHVHINRIPRRLIDMNRFESRGVSFRTYLTRDVKESLGNADMNAGVPNPLSSVQPFVMAFDIHSFCLKDAPASQCHTFSSSPATQTALHTNPQKAEFYPPFSDISDMIVMTSRKNNTLDSILQQNLKGALQGQFMSTIAPNENEISTNIQKRQVLVVENSPINDISHELENELGVPTYVLLVNDCPPPFPSQVSSLAQTPNESRTSDILAQAMCNFVRSVDTIVQREYANSKNE